MKTEEFNYDLPSHLIAQTPITTRSESKLMLVNKKTNQIESKVFKNIIEYINKDDVLVLNDTKVLPARLIGVKETTKAKIEILLLKETDKDIWTCLVKPAKRIKIGDIIIFSEKLKIECLTTEEEGIKTFKLIYEGILIEILEELGTMPLPPYIKERLEDSNRYQTVYAKELGSAAAPTAGLHFTEELLNKLKEKGVKIIYITLHVGLGTFRPVSVENITEHKMHKELYSIDKITAELLNKAKLNNNKIIAVGTTTLRTLESNIKKYSEFKSTTEETDIFICPGYKIKSIDTLITNFHLPMSTLLMLVSAFSSTELIKKAYSEAIKNEYRFFSFGDAMMIYE